MYGGRKLNYHENSSGSFSGLGSPVTDVGAPDFRRDFVDGWGGGGGVLSVECCILSYYLQICALIHNLYHIIEMGMVH